MSTEDQRPNVFVSRKSIEELARAFALSDAMLNMIVKAAEQFRATNSSINPESLISYISINRPKFMETEDGKN
jgi:hypothetical protein